MTTLWADLPNAVHIDRVIASVKAHPDPWLQVWFAANLVGAQVYAASWVAGHVLIKNNARLHEWSGATCSVWVARDAVLALIAYDDCAYMLDSDPGELAILAKLGDHRAILLLTACKVFHSLKEIV